MAFFSNAQETSGRYGGYIAEFQELFGKHEVKFGKPGDFLKLAPKLAHEEQFRREFTALTKSVGQREEGRLTRTRMLTIVAIALGGPELEKIEKNAVSISLLGVFLAGVGGWCETETQLQVEKPTVKVEEPTVKGDPLKVEPLVAKVEKPAIRMEPPVTKLDEAGGWGAIVAALNDNSENEEEEREALELEQRLSAGPRNDAEGMTTSLFGGTALVKEALSRLELNALELKLHLDSIDHRMERIEPHLDDLTARISTTVESVPLPETNGLPKGLPMQRFSLPEIGEIEESHVVEQAIVEPQMEAEKVGVVEPPVVSKPEETTRPRWVYWVMAALLLLAGAAGVFFYGRHAREVGGSRIAEAAAPSRPGGADAMHGLDPPGRGGGNGAAGPGVTLPKTAAQPVERQKVQAAAGQGGNTGEQVRGLDRNGSNQAGSGKTGLSQTGPENQPGREIRTEFGNQPGKIHVVKEEGPPPTVASGVHMPENLQGAIPSARMPWVRRLTVPDANASAPAAKSAADAPSGAAMTPAVHRTVFVAASTLSHNLIASPKPTYPQAAHFQRTEGDVMVRAVISEKGTVESVTVVSGPMALREAAVNAMRSWRYRPYLMSGKAVEVQTYVDFHFSLDR